MTNQNLFCFQFDDFRVEPRNYKIFHRDRALVLEPKTFQLLVFFLENRQRLVDKRELLDVVWKDIAVTENALTREVGKLRKVLGDDPKSPKYIETVHTRGYRFLADVTLVDAEPGVDSLSATGEEASGEEQNQDSTHTSFWRLKRVFVVLAILGLITVSAVFGRRPSLWTRVWAAKRGPTTLAVLPFHSLDGDPNDRYIGLGIADALITKLSNFAQLAVSPMSTILHYSDPWRDSLSIGRALNVDYVLEGKFQRLGDRMRITVQLLCVACNGTSRWAASFDETSKDLFQVQDSISQKVTAALPLELSRNEQAKLSRRETTQPEAQLASAKGKLLLDDDTKQSLDDATAQFRRALSLDPSYALAWTLLADASRRRELYGASPANFVPTTREALAKARDLDDKVAYTHSMLGLVAFQYDWDFATADREYRRALEIQPSWAQQWHARYLLATNHASEAEEEYRHFMRMVPFSAWGTTNFAQFLFLTRQYSRALDQVQKIVDAQPDYAPAHDLLGLVYEQQGLSDSAVREFRKAADLSNGYLGMASLGHLYAIQGKGTEAQQVLENLETPRKQRYVAPFERAVIYAGLGDTPKAMDDLKKAYSERSLSAQSLRFDPRLDNVRKDQRYHAFAARLGLN